MNHYCTYFDRELLAQGLALSTRAQPSVQTQRAQALPARMQRAASRGQRPPS